MGEIIFRIQCFPEHEMSSSWTALREAPVLANHPICSSGVRLSWSRGLRGCFSTRTHGPRMEKMSLPSLPEREQSGDTARTRNTAVGVWDVLFSPYCRAQNSSDTFCIAYSSALILSHPNCLKCIFLLVKRVVCGKWIKTMSKTFLFKCFDASGLCELRSRNLCYRISPLHLTLWNIGATVTLATGLLSPHTAHGLISNICRVYKVSRDSAVTACLPLLPFLFFEYINTQSTWIGTLLLAINLGDTVRRRGLWLNNTKQQ